MLPRLASGACAAVFVHIALAAAAPAQQCLRTFGPENGELRISQSISYDQIWPQAARGPSGWTFAWSQGQDVWARRFDFDLNPLGDQFQVNTQFVVGIQDEPAICAGTTGNVLVAWSDRQGYDGSAMGVFARVYGPDGTPLTGEFVVNSFTFASQWRPLIAPTPSGGWVVAWSGESDGNAYIRYLAANGTFLSNDLLVNTYLFDAQVDPCAAVNPQGVAFVAFVDYSAHGGVGTGINLYGRTYDAAHTPREPQEFVLTTFTSNGDQRDPRVAADGQGRFFVVWSDQLGDGNGYGIFERVFDSSGAPLGPEFQVNSTTAGDQRVPQIRVDAAGRSIVVWQDESQGAGAFQIRGRLFDADLAPVGPDFLVSDVPTVGAALPFLAADATTSNFVVGWQGYGNGTDMDLFGRWFQSSSGPHTYCISKTNSQGCTPLIGWTGAPSATDAAPFTITGYQVLNQKLGLLLYGYGSKFTPYQGSQICVAPPLKRLAIQSSGGSSSGTDCSGIFSTNFNARIQSGIDPQLVPGKTISARWFYRDPQDPAGFSSGLTNALRFTICP